MVHRHVGGVRGRQGRGVAAVLLGERGKVPGQLEEDGGAGGGPIAGEGKQREQVRLFLIVLFMLCCKVLSLSVMFVVNYFVVLFF